MTPYNKLIALDFETGTDNSNLDGLDVWHSDVEVKSLAISYYRKGGELVSKFYISQNQILRELTKISVNKIPILVFNATFELLVFKSKYPHLKFNVVADAMRLTQQEMTEVEGGFGLKNAVKHFFPNESHYEKDIYNWIENNIKIDGKKILKADQPKYLHLAPIDILRDYNVSDTIFTLKLYRLILDKWRLKGVKEDKIDLDHKIYLLKAQRIVNAKYYGVRVNTKLLRQNIENLDNKIKSIDEEFINTYKNEIQQVREILWESYIQNGLKTVKTDKGRLNWTKEKKQCPEFLINSTDHLRILFIEVLKQTPKKFTNKGNVSFSKDNIHQFEGVGLLTKRGSYLQARNQMKNLLGLADIDGMWHIDLKAAGTKTGRNAGGT